MNWWAYVLPPVLGLVIGYFTNDLAIKMLFRPYREYRVLGRGLPFTPGLIPQNQARLATKISDTIMGSLLTPSELQNLARRLLALERLQAAIRWLLKLGLERLQDPQQQQQTARVLGRILHDWFSESLPRLLKVMARQETFLEAQLNRIFDEILLNVRLSEEQARSISGWVWEQALPPSAIRQGLIDFLTDRNIEAIDEGFRDRATGTYWVVANLFGLRNALIRLRAYCIEEPTVTEQILGDLLKDIGASRRLTEIIQNLSLQNLPVHTVRQLRKGMRDAVRTYLRQQGPSVLQDLTDSIDWEDAAKLILGRLQKSEVLQEALPQVADDLALVFKRYLDRDLESLMTQVIPILNIDQVIVDRVNATSPQNLESAIQGIVKRELQAIVNLGGILGFVVGCIQVVILQFVR
ncbi:MAG: DUF445 family protein [Cyanobacteria bacterium J06639_1]